MFNRLAPFAAITVFIASAAAQVPIVDRMPGIPSGTEFRISNVEVQADIVDQVAKVQMAQTFRNISHRILQTQFLFPRPNDVAIQGLDSDRRWKGADGRMKPKDQARSEYEAIVRKQQDPALLEYVGHGLYRTSILPNSSGTGTTR